MRICYCLSHYHPVASGAERQAHLQATELTRRGHEVHVVTRRAAGLPSGELLDGVAIHRSIRPWDLGPLFGMTFVGSLVAALWELRQEFDLLHCHQALWEAVACGIAGPVLDKPSVVQPAAGGEYGEVHQLARTRGRAILRTLVLQNRQFVAISGQIADELQRLGVPASRITRLPSGVDTAWFRPGPARLENRLPPRPRVLFLGRLHAQKNVATLLAAWPAVRRRHAATLLLAGDGPERAALEQTARDLGCAGSVCFLGAVAEPLELLRSADLLVLPSLAEGMSNSLLEAMAVGLPVVVSRVGGNVDLVRDGETGVTLEPCDAAAWSEALVRLLGDRAARERLGRAARGWVEANHSIARVVDGYVELYERLLGFGS